MKKLLYILIGLSIQTNAIGQLQNLDFEQCDTSVAPHLNGFNCRYLNGWIRTNNGTAVNFVTDFSVENGGVPDAQNGTMALRLSVFYSYDKDMAYQKAPYTSFPESLSGYYTYTDNLIANNGQVEDDVATVTVLLTKWNTLLAQRDTIGFGELNLNGASNYTNFSLPINYASTTEPDSILIHLNCSRVREEPGVFGNMFGNNSYFTVDNLSLEGNALDVKSTSKTIDYKVFPNPGNGIIHIADFAGEIIVLDLNGKVIESKSYPDHEVNVSFLPKGVYMLGLLEESGQVTYTKYVKW